MRFQLIFIFVLYEWQTHLPGTELIDIQQRKIKLCWFLDMISCASHTPVRPAPQMSWIIYGNHSSTHNTAHQMALYISLAIFNFFFYCILFAPFFLLLLNLSIHSFGSMRNTFFFHKSNNFLHHFVLIFVLCVGLLELAAVIVSKSKIVRACASTQTLFSNWLCQCISK